MLGSCVVPCALCMVAVAERCARWAARRCWVLFCVPWCGRESPCSMALWCASRVWRPGYAAGGLVGVFPFYWILRCQSCGERGVACARLRGCQRGIWGSSVVATLVWIVKDPRRILLL